MFEESVLDGKEMKTTNSEYHLFILWEKGRVAQTKILSDLREHFDVLNLIEVTWSAENSSLNFSRFYGEHLPSNSEKEEECGIGPFLVVIVKDETPIYAERDTNRGIEIVNTNMFDAKMRYREWTGGGHKIHATNSEVESNHDITLLFGLNMHDFVEAHESKRNEIINVQLDIIGTDGWKSLEQLFYVLNNTTKYCVLRNYEMLPHDFRSDLHGDIDLLVANRTEIKWILNATPVFPEQYRVFHKTRVNNEDVFFDFRYIDDNYYDSRWERVILERAIMHNNACYVPYLEDYHYSLLYHACIHKHQVARDYKLVLKEFIPINDIDSQLTLLPYLDEYMSKMGYEYVKPIDNSVVYNQELLQQSRYAYRYGTFIKRMDEEINGVLCGTKIYKKDKSYIKVGSPVLIQNEVEQLKKFKGIKVFPQILSYYADGSVARFEMTQVSGVQIDTVLKNKVLLGQGYLVSLLEGLLTNLIYMAESRVMHRDMMPDNIFIDSVDGECTVSFIDLGWAVSLDQLNTCYNPADLGGSHKPKEGYSDAYSVGDILQEYINGLCPYSNRIIRDLLTITQEDYLSADALVKLRAILVDVQNGLNFKDKYYLYKRRHPKIARIIRKIRH